MSYRLGIIFAVVMVIVLLLVRRGGKRGPGDRFR
jgi:hypothetical protein